MSNNLGNLVIGITANTKGLQTAAGKVTGILGKIGRAATSLPGLLTGYGVARGAQSLIKLADSYTTMGTQLEYLTGNAQDAEYLQQSLYEIAKNTGTTMDANVGTYIKLSQAQSQTNLTAAENLKVLEAINVIFAKTGTTGPQASAALLQFGQALTSGKLAGDEFRSMSENAPGFLQKLADAMGIPMEDMKELSAQGKLTSKDMAAALLSIAESGEDTFEDLPKTAAKGWNAVVLAFSEAWDKINDETGFIGDIHNALLRLATWIEENHEVIKAWAVDAWAEFIKNAPEILQTIKDIGKTIIWLVKQIKYTIEWWDKFITKMRQNDKERTSMSRLGNNYVDPESEPEAAQTNLTPGTGSKVTNVFNTKLSRSDIVDITTNQSILMARL